MKRPEGFDPAPRQQQPSAKRMPARTDAKPRAAKRAPKPSRSAAREPAPTPATSMRPLAPDAPRASPARAPRISPSKAARPGASVRTELRQAARERRRMEKAEVRRFTRRARTRRTVLAAMAGLFAVLIALVLVAVYSPILALRTITVEGTARIDPAQVQEAVAGQLGTPLALVDFTRLTTELGAFPLIRSYVTETVPPDTLVIRIVERSPVGVVLRSGSYDLVDPAGVTIASSPERPAGIPFIDLGAASVDDLGFRTVVEVLLALPPELLAQVDTISATTQDDVTLVLMGVGQRVQWGNADDSAKKARVLAALIAVTDPSRAGEFDVSAPSSAVFSPTPEPPPPAAPTPAA